MDNNYFIREPLGNSFNDSKIERCWKSFSGKYGLWTTRVIQFDPYASMSSQPVKYILKEFEINKKFPDRLWIEKALGAFIRDEFAISDSSMPSFLPLNIEGEITITEDYVEKFLRNSEWENLIKVELPKDNTIEEMAKCIYELLCNPQIGSTKNRENNDKDSFVKQIIPDLIGQKRLLFVLPGFPFKDQNRFRVSYTAASVDFSEVCFLIRLHNLVQVLYQVHPFGGQAIVLSDGRLYQDIFHVSSEEVEEYQYRLRYYRNKLNIQGDVSIIDLKEMIERANENGEIDKIIEHIIQIIKDNCIDQPYFQLLVQGMKWNMNSKELLKELNDEDAWSILKYQRSDVHSNLTEIWDWYNQLAVEAAEKYAAINLMLKWTELIRNFLPESIRCTVHPKPNQFALATNYAWNGVAWSECWPISLKNITTVPIYKLQEQKSIKLVKFRDTNYPCFFTTEQYNQEFDFAKNVLKSEGWNIDDFFGREFSIFDLNDFIALGKNDKNFSWERKVMSKEYYTTLLQFRIKHYKEHGFGVHAIFQNGKLIGQMGLQVLDEQKQRLEYVIFLGKEYTNKGIGTRLLKYLFNRCKVEGIKTVYGVIRSDNAASEKLIKKFGGKKLKTVVHYHQSGILYEINL